MNSRTLVWKSLKHFWRTNLAIVLGIVVGSAVIGGALIVGDSVRGSLRELTLRRLGRVDYALSGNRFVREALAEELASSPEFRESYGDVAPALVMSGSLDRRQDEQVSNRAGGVSVYGVDERFWELTEHGDLDVPVEDGILLNERVAEQLQAQVGDRISLWIELPTSIPRDSLLGEREEVSREIELEVRAIATDEQAVGRFGLNASQQIPLNVFVSLETLQRQLDLSEIIPTQRRPKGRSARINTLFVAAHDQEDAELDRAIETAGQLTDLLESKLALSDVNIDVVAPETQPYVSVQSDQLILEQAWEQAVDELAREEGLERGPALIYLANEIRNPDRKRDKKAESPGYSMYSMIAGVELTEAGQSFGEFEFVSGNLNGSLAENEIVLNEWLASDLGLEVGGSLTLSYYMVGNHGELPESTKEFTVKAVVAMRGRAVDQGIVPEVQGITDVKSIGDWKQPFPMKMQLVTDRDEDYWDVYRATPKAFVSLDVAKNLWGSRYGELTSYRIGNRGGESDAIKTTVESGLRKNLTASRTGLRFRALKAEGLNAAVGANDFTGLFLAFSFFLIAAAAILIGLLFRLNVEKRSNSIGLLGAIGLPRQLIARQLVAESLVLAAVGAVTGAFVAVGYAGIMVYGLGTWWVGATGTTEIELVVQPFSVLIGAVATILVTTCVVFLSLAQLRNVSLRSLLLGGAEAILSTDSLPRAWSRTFMRLAFATAGILLLLGLLKLLPGSEAFRGFSWDVVSFFVVGLALLTGSLLLFGQSLSGQKGGRASESLGRLAFQNATRNRQRSVLTCGLIAFACFVIVAVAAGHRNPAIEYPDIQSGNGGFLLVAESSQGILENLNRAEDREDLGWRATMNWMKRFSGRCT